MKYEYGYDIWTDMLRYGDWGLPPRRHMPITRRKKNTQNIGKLLIFFCPQVKEEREKKNEVKLVINKS